MKRAYSGVYLSKMLGSKGMAFTFKLTLGESFCFFLDTMGARIHPAPVPAKKKKKSESAKRRDKKRRLEFLSPVSYTHLTLPTNREV